MNSLHRILAIKAFCLVLIILLSDKIIAQGVGINDDSSSPDGSAMLDVKSTSKGLLIPRMTTIERMAISTPATGLMVFDNTTLSFWYYEGSQWIEIGATVAESPFDTSGGMVIPRLGVVDETNDDFVFGSTQLDDDGNANHDSRLFFDKSLSALRAGSTNSTEWDETNIGTYSGAFGYNNTASGTYSTAWGGDNTASGESSTAFGRGNTASGAEATAFGFLNTASGWESTAWGFLNTASGTSSTAFGYDNIASGTYSTAWGENTEAPSGYETALGRYTTTYSANSTTGWNSVDRLFVIGNGTTNAARSNALTIYKNGTMNINDAYDMPTADGTTGQVMTTDGAGVVSWASISTLSDVDNDTKVEVEQSSDEDKIRFNLAGTEHFVMDGGRIGVMNTGQSVFLGENAGANDDLSNNNNTLIGWEAGDANTSGYRLVALGAGALGSNTTGHNNIAIGVSSMLGMSTGIYNISIGSSAMNGSSTASHNTAVGYAALRNIGTGSENVALGFGTGYNYTGNGSVFIGYHAGYNETNNDRLYIENSNSTTPLIYGEFDNDLVRINGDFNVTGDSETENNHYFGTDGAYLSGGNQGGSIELGPTNSSGGEIPFIDFHYGNGSTQDYNFRIINSADNTLSFAKNSGGTFITMNGTNGLLDVTGSVNTYFSSDYSHLTAGGNINSYNNGTLAVSIYADGIIAGFRCTSHSDRRIKDNLSATDNKEDLETLMNIKVTDYQFVDKVMHGNATEKKVIAQELKEVYPQAVVGNLTQVVPDIMQFAPAKEGWVRLENHNLKEGEIVRLVHQKDASEFEVLETKENAFRVAFEGEEQLLVYGSQVNDFHTVDYDAIAMLNVSATQAQQKLIEKLQKEIEDSRKQNTALKVANQEQKITLNTLSTTQKEMQAELRAIKAMLQIHAQK